MRIKFTHKSGAFRQAGTQPINLDRLLRRKSMLDAAIASVTGDIDRLNVAIDSHPTKHQIDLAEELRESLGILSEKMYEDLRIRMEAIIQEQRQIQHMQERMAELHARIEKMECSQQACLDDIEWCKQKIDEETSTVDADVEVLKARIAHHAAVKSYRTKRNVLTNRLKKLERRRGLVDMDVQRALSNQQRTSDEVNIPV